MCVCVCVLVCTWFYVYAGVCACTHTWRPDKGFKDSPPSDSLPLKQSQVFLAVL